MKAAGKTRPPPSKYGTGTSFFFPPEKYATEPPSTKETLLPPRTMSPLPPMLSQESSAPRALSASARGTPPPRVEGVRRSAEGERATAADGDGEARAAAGEAEAGAAVGAGDAPPSADAVPARTIAAEAANASAETERLLRRLFRRAPPGQRL